MRNHFVSPEYQGGSGRCLQGCTTLTKVLTEEQVPTLTLLSAHHPAGLNCGLATSGFAIRKNIGKFQEEANIYAVKTLCRSPREATAVPAPDTPFLRRWIPLPLWLALLHTSCFLLPLLAQAGSEQKQGQFWGEEGTKLVRWVGISRGPRPLQ